MNEAPILFQPDMARACYNKHKTQTRRLVKGDPWSVDLEDCPYGQVGDKLWVREPFRLVDATGWPIEGPPSLAGCRKPRVIYRSLCDNPNNGPWRPSIHMPRFASQMLLTIQNVSTEQLTDITDEDAIAEGILELVPPEFQECDPEGRAEWSNYHAVEATLETIGKFKGAELKRFLNSSVAKSLGIGGNGWDQHAKFKRTPNPWDVFQMLWMTINGVENWTTNPLVWVVEFETEIIA